MIGQTARPKKVLTIGKTETEPGTVFEYNDVRVNLLAYSLLHVEKAVVKEKIMDPMVLPLPGVGWI
jgi:hypothetical protein